MRGYGHTPYFVEGSDPKGMHQALAATLDHCLDGIREIQVEARATGQRKGHAVRRPWPMIMLTPKGWTGPKELDGKKIEGYWRSRRVPLADARSNDSHRGVLEKWMRTYKPEELFGPDGAPEPEIATLHPVGERRMSANPHANGGLLRRDLKMPDFRDYARSERRLTRNRCRGVHQGVGHVPARRDGTQHGQLPAVLPGRLSENACVGPPTTIRSTLPMTAAGTWETSRRSTSCISARPSATARATASVFPNIDS